MDGKITFEEHWALERTLGSFGRAADPTGHWEDLRRRLFDFHQWRLPEMDRHGIEYSIVSLNAPAVQGVPDAGEAAALARAANDELAAEVGAHPDRLGAFAALPMQDPEAAALELARCVREHGFKGAMVNGFTQRGSADSAIYYDLPEYRPFWAAVQELDVPFYLHPRLNLPSRELVYEGHPWLFAPAWDFAAATSIHALRLICCGLFDEFPGLKIVLGHLGERIPFDLWRIDNLMKKPPTGIPAKRSVGDYFRSNFHLTTSGHFHDPPFRCALAEMGVDRMLFSIDYPFETTEAGARWFDETELSDEDRRKIGRTNAIELFGLDLS